MWEKFRVKSGPSRTSLLLILGQSCWCYSKKDIWMHRTGQKDAGGVWVYGHVDEHRHIAPQVLDCVLPSAGVNHLRFWKDFWYSRESKLFWVTKDGMWMFKGISKGGSLESIVLGFILHLNSPLKSKIWRVHRVPVAEFFTWLLPNWEFGTVFIQRTFVKLVP